MAGKEKYLFGPVPSRRLGLSLGVDIVPGPHFAISGKTGTPFKVCSLDCVYCQLGRTTEKTIERKDYVSVETVLAELKEGLAQGMEADFITFSGSGEPTLNCRLGEFIGSIKKITDIPVAILTNGTLLYRQDVRCDCARADVVLPSLDASDEQTFQKINRPHKDISVEKLISGLCAFRNEFSGQTWLEVFLVEGFNTGAEQIAGIKDAIKRIGADKIQLNTAVRPTADAGIKRVKAEKLGAIAKELGGNCEVVADFPPARRSTGIESKAEDTLRPHFTRSPAISHKMAVVLSMLKRRPCSLNDLCSGLGIGRNEALKCISHFEKEGVVGSQEKDGIIFFKAN